MSHYKNPDCVEIRYAFTGNTAVTGTKGNIKTYTAEQRLGERQRVQPHDRRHWSTAYVGAIPTVWESPTPRRTAAAAPTASTMSAS